MAQAVDLVVDGGVLLDIGIGRGDVRLRLIVVIVGDEILDGVVREELAQLGAQLRGERFIVREHERRALCLLDDVGHGEGLARAGNALERNRFRVRGDTVEIWPVYSDEDVVRVEFFGDEVDRISRINPLTGVPLGELSHIAVFPASHYVTPKEKLDEAIKDLEEELEQRVRYFEENGKLIEAQRIAQRTRYDIEMLQEIGFCSGIENYSRVLSRRAPGSSPYTLIDYFPKDFLLIVDESHVTLPQVRAMYHGDRARKESLVENGFRLPSAYDNRPLNFDEFNERLNQIVYVSATPGEYELSRSGQVVEQVIRPTGLLDPEVVVRPVDGQIDDLIGEINARTDRGERVLVTTLTKKMAEDLTDYLETAGIKVRSAGGSRFRPDFPCARGRRDTSRGPAAG